MDDLAIKVEHISKIFRLPHEKNTSIKSALINFTPRKRFEMQQALKDVSFEVKKGEFFGIIGRNGSGKSTMLKLLAGIYSPTEGILQINGKLTPFIELGVGFNPELTGRENVYLNGALLGFNRREMQAMYKDIVEFAELERFMDQKLKNYSSGMQVRLAFSIAIRAKSDILLIDEVLAVGDVNFQRKCIGVFEDLKRAGRTIVFVSHSMGDVREFCDRVAVIDGGDLLFCGSTEEGIDLYNKLNFEAERQRTESENKSPRNVKRFGNGKARIDSYHFLNEEGKKTTRLSAAKKFSVEIAISFHGEVKNPAIGIMFKKNPQEILYGINNFYEKFKVGQMKKGDRIKFRASGVMPLASGIYYVSLSITDARSAANYSELDLLDNVLKINVEGRDYWGTLATDNIKLEVTKQ